MKLVKKSIIILCISILCLMCTQIISSAQTAKITTETLRLRKKPTTNSSIVELMSEGETVEILESGLGDDGNWYKVKYKTSEGNITGYAYGEFLKINNKTTGTSNNNTSANTNTNTNTSKPTNTNTVENTTNTVIENTVVNNTIENNIIENTTTENNVIVENTTTNNNEVENNNVVTEPEVNTEPAVDSTTKIEINTFKTIEENEELYIIPLINADKIHTVEAKQKIYVIQALNGWAYVSLEDNSTGWIRCSKLIDIE